MATKKKLAQHDEFDGTTVITNGGRRLKLPQIDGYYANQWNVNVDGVQDACAGLNIEQAKARLLYADAEGNNNSELALAWRTAQVAMVNHGRTLSTLMRTLETLNDPSVAHAVALKEQLERLASKVEELTSDLERHERNNEHTSRNDF